MKLAELAPIVHGVLTGQDAQFKQVSIDTRTLQAGDLYWAIRGERFDGHAFVAQARAKGAVGAIVSQPVSESDLPVITVDETLKALGDYAHYHRRQYSLPVIALTGSCGKTTTKTLIAAILQQQGAALATSGNMNNDIGVPLTLLQLRHDHRYAVLELGANRAGDIAYTAALVEPQVALITNIGLAHIEGFGSLDGVARAKAEIYQSLDATSIAVINADELYAARWLTQLPTARVMTFGCEQPADVMGRCLEMDEQGHARIAVNGFDTTLELTLPLPGRHNISNVLAAICACVAVDIPLAAIERGLQQVPAVNGRLQPHAHESGALLIDDTYNANPSSVAAALRYIADLPGKKILVLGDLAELGPQTQAYHTQLGQLANELGMDAVFTYGQNSYYTSQAFAGQSQHFTDLPSLVETLEAYLAAGTVILFKGSRSAQMEKVLHAVIQP